MKFKKTIELLQKELPDLEAVYLFGSTETEFERTESDIDLALLSKNPVDPVVLFETQEKIAALTGKDVDLVDLKQANPVFQVEVISKGKLIHLSNHAKTSKTVERFEMIALSQYAQLNEERKLILNDIEKRGKILND